MAGKIIIHKDKPEAEDKLHRQLKHAFEDVKVEVEKRLKAEMGGDFISVLSQKLEGIVERIPRRVDDRIDEIMRDRLKNLVEGTIKAEMRQMWGSFIQNEIVKYTTSADFVLAVAKKVKEIS